MKKAEVIIFGSSGSQDICDCDETMAAGCEGCKSGAGYMEKEAEHLRKMLEKKYGDTLEFRYVNVESEEMDKYPGVKEILGVYRLPITVVNGEPCFHGWLSAKKISEIIDVIH
jgi:disulfide oxidoreductase YuzD